QGLAEPEPGEPIRPLDGDPQAENGRQSQASRAAEDEDERSRHRHGADLRLSPQGKAAAQPGVPPGELPPAKNRLPQGLELVEHIIPVGKAQVVSGIRQDGETERGDPQPQNPGNPPRGKRIDLPILRPRGTWPCVPGTNLPETPKPCHD